MPMQPRPTADTTSPWAPSARFSTRRSLTVSRVHLPGMAIPLVDVRAQYAPLIDTVKGRLAAVPAGVPVIEDAAQAFGAPRVGSLGVAATFSFFPTKNLFGLGDGGLVATADRELAARVRTLRLHGSRGTKDFQLIGYNSRLDELQAAVLRLFLPRLDGWNRARREAAAIYAGLGLGELCELPEDEPGHVYHMYVVRSPVRDRIAAPLRPPGIAPARYS